MNDPKTVIGALIDTCRLRKYLDEEILVEETGGMQEVFNAVCKVKWAGANNKLQE